MKKAKYGILLLFVVFLSGTLFININNSSNAGLDHSADFGEWRENKAEINNPSANCDCHASAFTNNLGSGVLEIYANSTAYSLLSYSVTLRVKGFTDAANEKITIGFINDPNYVNNSLFIPGGATDVRQALIDVDGSGNSNNVTLNLVAPNSVGNYSIKADAVYSGSGLDFYYLTNTTSVQTVQPPDNTPPSVNSVKFNNVELVNQTQFGGNIFLSINATDQYLAGVRYSLNGSDLVSMQLNATSNLYTDTFNTFSYSNGPFTLLINAYDSNNNQANKTYSLEVNNTGLSPTADITAFMADKEISISDGKIDSLWTDYPEVSIPEFGQGGYIKTAHTNYYFFALIAYSSSNTWVSIEFDAKSGQDNHMFNGHDAWTFGVDQSPDYIGDGYFVGASGAPLGDARKDIFYEIIEKDNMVYVELIRALDTHDPDGHDVVFNTTSIIDVQFASSTDHKSDHNIMTWTLSILGPSGTTLPTSSTQAAPPPGQISDFVFVFSFVIVLFTVVIHASLRVVSKPIKHDKRLVQVDRLPDQPSLVQILRNRGKKSSKPDKKEG
ncbi:MAG: hypothetical protein ACFFD1_04805 [Candidatus Thorarchaeota archaeon]